MSENKNETPLVRGAKEEFRRESWRIIAVYKSVAVHLILVTLWGLLDIAVKNHFLVGMLDDAIEWIPALTSYAAVAWLFYEIFLKTRSQNPVRQAIFWPISTHPLMYSPFKDDWKFLTDFRIFPTKTPR